MKNLNSRQWAAIKRVATTVNPLLARRLKLEAQLKKANEEISSINEEIAAHEAGVIAMTGVTSEDLVTRVVDENKIAKYVPNEDKVTYDEESKTYQIKDDILADPDEVTENSEETTSEDSNVENN